MALRVPYNGLGVSYCVTMRRPEIPVFIIVMRKRFV